MFKKLLDWLYDRRTERLARLAPRKAFHCIELACDGDNPRYRDMRVRDAQIIERETRG